MQITFTLSQPWFHGPLNTEEAQKLLSSYDPSSYLFRFSSRAGCFALSVKKEDDTMAHYLISRTPRGLELEGVYYDSLEEIESTQTTRYHLRNPVASPRYQWIFSGAGGMGGGGYVNEGYVNRGAASSTFGGMDVQDERE
eukprot:TRINITY_DN475_c1_g1_i3.p2 TRINITY_DN475_c1_g1~~TRINITY_DN475_c1_g1_i3.p2  ORF type:complete len:140 (-),score=28.72 TRINITY_DN475_c1_g1_i3:265-684(-)